MAAAAVALKGLGLPAFQAVTDDMIDFIADAVTAVHPSLSLSVIQMLTAVRLQNFDMEEKAKNEGAGPSST